MKHLRKKIFLGLARKTNIDFNNIGGLFRGNEKIFYRIHRWNAGLPPFMGGSPEEEETLTGSFAFAGG